MDKDNHEDIAQKPVTYVLHPGYIRNKNDEQVHYIGMAALQELYRILPGNKVLIYNPYTRYPKDATHLYPNYNGDYKLPQGVVGD